MAYKPKICVRCGGAYTPASSRQMYCVGCGVVLRAEYHREYYKLNRVNVAERERVYRKVNAVNIARRKREHYKVNEVKIEGQRRLHRSTPHGKLVARRQRMKAKRKEYEAQLRAILMQDKELENGRREPEGHDDGAAVGGSENGD